MAIDTNTHTNTKGAAVAPEPKPTATAPMRDSRGAAELRLSVEERQERGRAMRVRTPRAAHAYWAEAPNRPDPIALLQSQATTRLQDLVPIRYARMRLSPFAFLRGSAIVMANDLAQTPRTGIQTQLCGDAHCSNFGAFASPERTLLFDINDLDETYPGPWEWDVKRLAASLYVAGRNNGFSEAVNRTVAVAAAASYRQHMAELASMSTLDVWYTHVTADDLLNVLTNKQLKKQAQKAVVKIRQRGSMRAFDKLTEVVDGRPIIANDPPLVMRVTEEVMGTEVRTIMDKYQQTLPSAQRHVLERFEVLDVALKVVGVGSVGTRCFIVLLMGRDNSDPLFLQVKEAEMSVLEPHLQRGVYKQQGERVVGGLELMQAASDIFLGWLTGPQGRFFYVRQLHDMKGSIEVENQSPATLELYARLCGHTLARAHARASGNAVEIAAYLGVNDQFDLALGSFAEAYANQTERDYAALLAAIKSGRIVSAMGA